jgi:hypothetical protein
VPRHVAWPVTRLVAPLVVDYFDYTARPGASARRAARHAALRTARRRLLQLHRAFGCLGTSRGSSRGSSRRSSRDSLRRSSSTTSPTSRVRVPRHVARLVARLIVDYFALSRLVVNYFASRRLIVDYFAYTTHSGASARRAARRAAHRRLLRLAQARRRLLHLRRASGCLGTSRGLSRGSSSTTS